MIAAAPYVAALVVVREPRSLEWRAAIVTRLCDQRKQHAGGDWIPAVDVSIFRPGGGVYAARFVGRPGATFDRDEPSDEYVWLWPQEIA